MTRFIIAILLAASVLTLFLPVPALAGGAGPKFLTESAAAAYLLLKADLASLTTEISARQAADATLTATLASETANRIASDSLKANNNASGVTATDSWRAAIGAMAQDGTNSSSTVNFNGQVTASGTTLGSPPLFGWIQDGVLRGQVELSATGSMEIICGGGQSAISIASDTKAVKMIENLPYAILTAASNQIIPNTTATVATFTDEVDSYGIAVPADGTITAPCAGVYMVWGAASWDGSKTGTRIITFTVDGSGLKCPESDIEALNSVVYPRQNPSGFVVLTAGQVVRMVVYQDSGSDLSILAGPGKAIFGLACIRRT